MRLSVILINYNSQCELEKFFPVIFRGVRTAIPGAEFIVIDNASSDGGVAFVRDHFPEVIVHAESKNIYFGPAANRGFGLANGELVLLLNPDVAIEHLDFTDISERFQRDPKLFSIHPHIHDPRDGKEECFFALEMCRGIVDIKPLGAMPEGGAREVPFVTGGAAFFRRSLFLELGGFDPLFVPFYWEDADLGVRAVRRGLKNMFLPSSRFLHWHSTIIGRNYNQQQIKAIYERNRLLFYYKHVSLLSKAFISHFFWLLPRLFYSLLGDRHFLGGFIKLPAKFSALHRSRLALHRSGPIIPLFKVISQFKVQGNE